MDRVPKTIIAGILTLFILTVLFQAVCGAEEIARYPVDSLDGIITRSNVYFDRTVSSDGNGSARIEAQEPTTVRLFERSLSGLENTRLIYLARLRTEEMSGVVYLEMWLRFPEKGRFFSRGLNDALRGTNEWATVETPFFLQKGQRPDYLTLNLVVNGTGMVWIDEIQILREPLN